MNVFFSALEQLVFFSASARMKIVLLALAAVFAPVSFACAEGLEAGKPLRAFSEPGLSDRYVELVDELRCPKCQNQNLADSDAPIAKDLRDELFRLLEEGNSNQQILDFMTLRYGEFVRYRPELSSHTAGLWLIPLGAILCGFIIWLLMMRRGASGSAEGNAVTVDTEENIAEKDGSKALARDKKVAALIDSLANDSVKKHGP